MPKCMTCICRIGTLQFSMTSTVTDDEVTEYIKNKYATLHDLVKRDGLTAYLREPPARGRINQRFLQNTLKAVSHDNTRGDQSREADSTRRRHKPPKRARSPSLDPPARTPPRQRCRTPSESPFPHKSESRSPDHQPQCTNSQHTADDADNCVAEDSATAAAADEHTHGAMNAGSRHTQEGWQRDEKLHERLSSVPSRGRGGIGTRVFDTGPDPPNEGPVDAPIAFRSQTSTLLGGLVARPTPAVLGRKSTADAASIQQYVDSGLPYELAVAQAELDGLKSKHSHKKDKHKSKSSKSMDKEKKKGRKSE